MTRILRELPSDPAERSRSLGLVALLLLLSFRYLLSLSMLFPDHNDSLC